MILCEVCPMCCGQTVVRKVTKVISGGVTTATIEVQAEVCSNCGEKLYSADTVRLFQEIKAKLERQELTNLILTFQSEKALAMLGKVEKK